VPNEGEDGADGQEYGQDGEAVGEGGESGDRSDQERAAGVAEFAAEFG
jgi:hypothetical protein